MTQTSDIAQEIDALVDAELAALDPADHAQVLLARDFRALRVRPSPVTVNFSGGITQRCWIVTRSNGLYQVIYLPTAGYFSLCMDSDFGPLDMGVHGPALGCFGSV